MQQIRGMRCINPVCMFSCFKPRDHESRGGANWIQGFIPRQKLWSLVEADDKHTKLRYHLLFSLCPFLFRFCAYAKILGYILIIVFGMAGRCAVAAATSAAIFSNCTRWCPQLQQYVLVHVMVRKYWLTRTYHRFCLIVSLARTDRLMLFSKVRTCHFVASMDTRIWSR